MFAMDTLQDMERDYSRDFLLDIMKENGYERGEAITALIDCLTELGVVVVYYDDTVARRENPELVPDTPLPA